MKKSKKISLLAAAGTLTLVSATVVSCSTYGPLVPKAEIYRSEVTLKDSSQSSISVVAGQKAVNVQFICTFYDKNNKVIEDNNVDWSFELFKDKRKVTNVEPSFTIDSDGLLKIDASSCASNFSETYEVVVYGNTITKSLSGNRLGHKSINAAVEGFSEVTRSVAEASVLTLSVRDNSSTESIKSSDLTCTFYDENGPVIGVTPKWIVYDVTNDPIPVTFPIQNNGAVITFNTSSGKLDVDATNYTGDGVNYDLQFEAQTNDETVTDHTDATVSIVIAKTKLTSSEITSAPESALEVTAGTNIPATFTFVGQFLDQFNQPFTATKNWKATVNNKPDNVSVGINSTSGELTINALNNHDTADATFTVDVSLQDENETLAGQDLGKTTVTVNMKADHAADKSSVSGNGSITVTAGKNAISGGEAEETYTPYFENAGQKDITSFITPTWEVSNPDKEAAAADGIIIGFSAETKKLTVNATESHVNAIKTYTVTLKANDATQSMEESKMTPLTVTINVNPDITPTRSTVTSSGSATMTITSGSTTSGSDSRSFTATFYNAGNKDITSYISNPIWNHTVVGNVPAGVNVQYNGASVTVDAVNTHFNTNQSFTIQFWANDSQSTLTEDQMTKFELDVSIAPDLNYKSSTITTGTNSFTLDGGTDSFADNYEVTYYNAGGNVVPGPELDNTWFHFDKVDEESWPSDDDLKVSWGFIRGKNQIVFDVDSRGYNPQTQKVLQAKLYAEPVATVQGFTANAYNVTITINPSTTIVDHSTVTGGSDITLDAGTSATAENAYTPTFYDVAGNVMSGIDPDYVIETTTSKPENVSVSIDTDNKLVVDATNYNGENVEFNVTVSANPKDKGVLDPEQRTGVTVTVSIKAAQSTLTRSVVTGSNSLTMSCQTGATSDAPYLASFYDQNDQLIDNQKVKWEVTAAPDSAIPENVEVSIDKNDRLYVNAINYDPDVATSFKILITANVDDAPASFTPGSEEVTINVQKPDPTTMKSVVSEGATNVVVNAETTYTAEIPYKVVFTVNDVVTQNIPSWSYTVKTGTLPENAVITVGADNKLVVNADNVAYNTSTDIKITLTCEAAEHSQATSTSWGTIDVNIKFVPATTVNTMTYNNGTSDVSVRLADDFDPNIFTDEGEWTIPIKNGDPITIAANERNKIKKLSLLDVSESTTQINANFLSGCTNLDTLVLTGISEDTIIKGNFLQNCDNLTTVDMGSIKAENMTDSSTSNETYFTTTNGSATCITKGLSIIGTDRANIINTFPNRLPGESESPYRKLIGIGNTITYQGVVYAVKDDINPNTVFCKGSSEAFSVPLANGSSLTISNANKKYITSVELKSLDPTFTAFTSSYFLGGCSNLTYLDLSGFTNVKTIFNYFLYNCTGLKTVNLTGLENVTTVGPYFMSGCSALESIDLTPLQSVETIGQKFLADCYSLTSVDIRPLKNLTFIGTGTSGTIYGNFLDNCRNIKTVIVPNWKLASGDLIRFNGWGTLVSLQYIRCGSDELISAYSTNKFGTGNANGWAGTSKPDAAQFVI